MKKKQKMEIKNQLNKEMKIILGSMAVIALVAISIYFLFTGKKPEETTTLSSPSTLTREFNQKKGPDDAKVKIVEFYDPECEACAGFFPFVKEAMARYEGKVQLTVRYALYHGNSILAAKATDAAGLQGKFWEFQELLFLNQHEWSHKQEPSTAYFVKYAQDLNLDIAKFKTDMENMGRMETINQDLTDGKALGVNGTPTIFINGKMLDRINPSHFFEKIEEELRK